MKTKNMPPFYKWVSVHNDGSLHPYSPGIYSINHYVTYVPKKYTLAPKSLLRKGFGITGFTDKQLAKIYGTCVACELWLCEITDLFDPPPSRAGYQSFTNIPQFLDAWKRYNNEEYFLTEKFSLWPFGTKMTSQVKLIKRLIHYK